MISGRRYVSIEVDKQDVAAMLVSAGMAKAQDKRQGEEPLHAALIAAQDEPQKKKIGVWTVNEDQIKKHTRQVVYFGEADYNPTKILTES